MLCLLLLASAPRAEEADPGPAAGRALEEAYEALEAANAALDQIRLEAPREEFDSWQMYTYSLPALRPLPAGAAYTLRVLYLEDPRLPSLTLAQRNDLYAKAELLLRDWYGYKVRIEELGAMPVLEYFRRSEAKFRLRHAADLIRDATVDMEAFGGKDLLLSVIRQDFEKRDLELLRRYFPLAEGDGKREAVRVAYEQFESRLKALRAVPAGERDADVFRSPEYAITQSFPHWEVLMNEERDADFILTNTVIAGPDAYMPVYVIARGGVTTGFVTNSRWRPYQAAGIVGLFPFLSEAEFWRKHRGPIPDAEKLGAAATFWMHELGHFFLRYAEAYADPGCVHAAPEGLDYYQWHRKVRLSNNACKEKPATLTLY